MSERDVAVALSLMRPYQRAFMRNCAAGRLSHAQLDRAASRTATSSDAIATSGVDGTLVQLVRCLQDRDNDSSAMQLQPPYGALLVQWVTKSGALAVTVSPTTKQLQLSADVVNNLVFLWNHRRTLDGVTEGCRQPRHRGLSVLDEPRHRGLSTAYRSPSWSHWQVTASA